jgi:hypothetical protein
VTHRIDLVLRAERRPIFRCKLRIGCPSSLPDTPTEPVSPYDAAPRRGSDAVAPATAFSPHAGRNKRMTVINWRPVYQPLVTTGAGDFPIGYLPIGALPIGIFPIGALPMTGCGGGGWGCGRSEATAALRHSERRCSDNEKFHSVSPNDPTQIGVSRPRPHRDFSLVTSRQQVRCSQNRRARITVSGRCCSGATPRQVRPQ